MGPRACGSRVESLPVNQGDPLQLYSMGKPL